MFDDFSLWPESASSVSGSIDALYLSSEFTSGPGRSRTLRTSLERDPRFRADFPVVHRFDDGAMFFARERR